MEAERLLELGAVILGLAIAARLAGRIGIPAIPLYLLAGLAFGKGGVFPLVTTTGFIELGSEIGLILLLFMLGLEYSARELVTAIKGSVRTGIADVVVNFAPGFLCAYLLGLGFVSALMLGGITLVTSSGIAAKIISDLGWTGSRAAGVVISICVIEDLTMALYLPIVGAIVVGGATLLGFGSAALAIAGVVVVLALAMRVEVGLSRILFSHSDEVLLLTILGLAVLVAGLAELVEVSAAVGALIIGIALSGPAAHGARQLLEPLRDLFSAFFFAFIGLQVDPGSLPPVLGTAIALGVVGIGTKAVTGWFATREGGFSRTERTRTAAALMPRGEFSLAIAALAATVGLPRKLTSVAVAYVIFLAVIGPVIARATDVVERRAAVESRPG
jgi:K+:H+ antiporter subunit KhtU